MTKQFSRRDFLSVASLSAAGVALSCTGSKSISRELNESQTIENRIKTKFGIKEIKYDSQNEKSVGKLLSLENALNEVGDNWKNFYTFCNIRPISIDLTYLDGTTQTNVDEMPSIGKIRLLNYPSSIDNQELIEKIMINFFLQAKSSRTIFSSWENLIPRELKDKRYISSWPEGYKGPKNGYLKPVDDKFRKYSTIFDISSYIAEAVNQMMIIRAYEKNKPYNNKGSVVCSLPPPTIIPENEMLSPENGKIYRKNFQILSLFKLINRDEYDLIMDVLNPENAKIYQKKLQVLSLFKLINRDEYDLIKDVFSPSGYNKKQTILDKIIKKF